MGMVVPKKYRCYLTWTLTGVWQFSCPSIRWQTTHLQKALKQLGSIVVFKQGFIRLLPKRRVGIIA
jgi:hypothetical protein